MARFSNHISVRHCSIAESTDNKPLISIIMPFLNVEEYIGEAVKSVINQSFYDWELIAVDSESTDSSRIIVEGLQKQDSRIRLFDEKRRGVAYARNLGLKVSRGEFVAFIDADDLYCPEKLKAQFMLMQKNPQVSCCFTAHSVVYNDGSITDMILNKSSESVLSDDFLRYFLLRSQYTSLCLATALIRKRVINDNAFDVRLKRGEDWDFFLRVLRNKKSCYLRKPTYFYRTRKNSITHNASARWNYLDSRIQIYLKLLPVVPSLSLKVTVAKKIFWLIFSNTRELRPLVESRVARMHGAD